MSSYMNKIRTLAIPLLAAGLAISGCKKMDLAPYDRYTELNFWQSDANVQNALNNVYNRMYTSNMYFWSEPITDNASARGGGGQEDLIASGNFTKTLGKFLGDWSYFYTGIKAENLFMDFVDQNTTLDPALKDRMKGEVRFVRAFHYFKLMTRFGDVPLFSTDITPDEAKNIARSPKAEVLKFILDELDAAAAILPNTYPAADRGRITKGAALALKARVLLYQGDRMAEVVATCERIMNGEAGAYSLQPSYSSVFAPNNEYNSEVLLDLQYVPNLRTWGEYFDLAPLSAGARTNGFAPTQELVNSYIMTNGQPITAAGSGYNEVTPYVNRDPRLSQTIVVHGSSFTLQNGTSKVIYIQPGTDPNTAAPDEYRASGQGTTTGYYWRKWYDQTSVTTFNSGLNLILIRYAEVLMMYAEAKQSLGQLDAAVWNQTIRPIRARAGFTDPGALNFPAGGNLQDVVRNERRAEFALEDLRFDDIRRWRIAEQVMNGWAHGAKYGDPTVDNGYIRAQLRVFEPGKHYLWPIPDADVLKNPNLTQNPGY